MKAEDKILELLADYLKKSDQLLDRMDKTERGIEIMSKALAEHSIKFNESNEKFNVINEKFNVINEKFNVINEKFNESNEKFNVVNQEIKQLREENSIVLKELVSLSKRVAEKEEKH